jgi:hypothetical protein
MKKILNGYTGNYPSLNSILSVTRGHSSFGGAHMLSILTVGRLPASILGAYRLAADRFTYPICNHHLTKPKVSGIGTVIFASTAMAFRSCLFFDSLVSRTGVFLFMSLMNFARPSWPVPAITWFGMFKLPVKTINCRANNEKNHLNKYTGKDWVGGLVEVFVPVGSVLMMLAALSLADDFILRCLGAARGIYG